MRIKLINTDETEQAEDPYLKLGAAVVLQAVYEARQGDLDALKWLIDPASIAALILPELGIDGAKFRRWCDETYTRIKSGKIPPRKCTGRDLLHKHKASYYRYKTPLGAYAGENPVLAKRTEEGRKMTKQKVITRQGLSIGMDVLIRKFMRENGIENYAEGFRQYSKKYPSVIQAWQQAPALGRKLSIEIEK